MAIVDIPGRESIEVPDSWGSDEVTDFVRRSHPDLFEGPALNAPTYGPDRAPLSPEARAARIAEIRGTPAENRRFAEDQSRIADLDALAAARDAGGLRSFLEASDVMAGPRRVVAGASNFLRVPGAIANIQLAPLLAMDATKPAASRAAQLLSDLDRSITGAGDVLRSSERPDAEPTVADVFRSGRDLGPVAALADLGTLGVNAIADSAAYILPGGLVAKGLAGAGVSAKAAQILGPLISVAPVETADALAEYVDAKADPVAARIVAPIVGFINGALESVTDSKVLARLGGGDAAKKSAARFLVGQMLGEGLTEGLQEGTTIGGRAALTGDPGPDALNRVATAVVGGALGGAGIGGVTEGVRRMAEPAPPNIGARGVPVEVARAELASGSVPVGPPPPTGPVPVGLGAARDYVPLGKRKRARKVIKFVDIAEEEGVSDLVDFVPEAKTTPEGVPIEAEFSGGRAKVYTPNVRNEKRFRGALREEKAHGWIATEPGQAALTEFLDQQPLTDAEFTKLQKEGYLQTPDEDVAAYTRRLSDEFVAKLNRDPKWKQWVGEAIAWVKKSIGVSLTNTQAGRLMLRNLRKAGVGQTGGQSRQSVVGWDAIPGQTPVAKSPEVAALEQKWAEAGVRLQVSETSSGLTLNVIESPGKGLGGQALADVVRLSESRGVPVSLTASAQPGRADDLARFYERAGFQKVAEDPLSKKPIYRRTPAPRFSLAPDKLPAIVSGIQRQFPSAPPIVVSERKSAFPEDYIPDVDRISDPDNVGGEEPAPLSKAATDYLDSLPEVSLAGVPSSSAPGTSLQEDPELYYRSGQGIEDFEGRRLRHMDRGRIWPDAFILEMGSNPERVFDTGANNTLRGEVSDVRRILVDVKAYAPEDLPTVLAPFRERFPNAPVVYVQQTETEDGYVYAAPPVPKLRFSLAPDKIPGVVSGIQRQFPSAPPIVVSETPDPRGAYFDGTSIVVSPATLPGNPAAAKSVVTAALIESGLTKVFGDDFVGETYAMLRAGDPARTARMAERIGADTKTPEGQRAVLSEVLRLQQDSRRMSPFLRRWAQKLRLVKTDKLSEALDRAARTTLAAYEGSEPIPGGRATAQDQVYADLNRSVWTYARPFIQSIRNIAIEERLDAEDTARHRNMSNRMNALADNARARDIGAGVEQAWNPVDEDFMDRLDAAGVPTTDSDRTLHAAYRREALARGLVPTLDALDDVDAAIADVVRAKPGYDIANDELTTEQTALRKRIADADPDVLTRAMELRSRSERRWQSRAAVDALRDPQVAAWADIVERIEASGATPREGPVSPNLADAATVARDTLALTWSPFRRRTQEAYNKFMAEAYPAALTPLRERLERLRSDRAQAQIAVGEILAALRGVMGLSGSTEDRATAEFLLENDEILRRFIVALANATPDGEVARLRDRIEVGGEATGNDIRAAARDAGVSPDALIRLVEHLRQSPGVRNAVVEGMAAINRSISDSAITAIRQIESGEETAQTMAPAIARFVRSRGRASDAMTGVERDIRELEARRLQLALLRDAGAVGIPESELGVAEMIYDGADGGVIFKGFTNADGTTQEQITLRPGEEYTNATLARLAEWQENARAAVEAESNEAPVTRGLNVGVQIANQFIDASFTPDQIAGTPAPGMLGDLTQGHPLTLWQNFGNRNTLARSVFGVQGRALMAAARELDLAGQTKDSLTKSYVRRNRRAMLDAAESLDLDLGVPGDSERLRDARNEVAHRFGRQFEAGPAVGELLIALPGKRITPELLNVIRLDREIGRKAQEKERRRNYGGVRINLPGQRIVRPPAETGDLGLSRSYRGHEEAIRMLAEAHQSKDPMRIAAFWDSPEARSGLLWHVLDAGRSDLARPRQLGEAEILAAQRITHGRVPAPRTFDEMVSLLIDTSGLSRSEVRSKLLSELAEYGRVASAKYPTDGTSPKTVEGSFSGEGDLTPFTMQAAPLVFPSSWYDYGSARSLDQFLELVVDAPQRAYLTRAKESAAELRATAARIRKAVAEGDAAELKNLNGVIRWYTNKAVSAWRGKRVTEARAEAAAKYMDWVSKRLDADVVGVDASKFNVSAQRAISSVMPFLLSWINTAMTNVVGGPLTSYFAYRPLYGPAEAAARAMGQMLVAPAHFVWDRAEAALERLGVSIPSRQERLAYLEGYGVAGSYSRLEYGESEAWSRGETTAGPIRRGFQSAQDAANAVSEVAGVRMGDSALNQQLTRIVLPDWFGRMQRIHDAWAARLAREGLTYSPDNSATHLSDAELSGGATVRELLGQFSAFGGTPEEILVRLRSIRPKLFFRDEVAGRIGSFLLSEMNAATRSNRPQSNPLLALLGWTSHVIGLVASDVRTTPDTNRAKALAQIAIRTLAFSAVSAFAYYLGRIARRGVNISQTEVAEAIQQILLGLDDDDDIDGLLDALSALSRAIRRIPGTHYPLDFAARMAGAMKTPATDPTMTPVDAAWWSQPAADIALDLAAAPVRGIGIDPENPRFPTFGIVDSIGRGALQTGRGVGELAIGTIRGDEGTTAAGVADTSEGVRKMLSVLSMFGQFTYNMIDPGAVESKAAKAEVIRAARAAGIPIEKPRAGVGGIMPATPVEAALRNAARDGDEDRMRALAKFAFDRSYERAIDRGQSPDEARSAGEASVKSLLTALDPVRDAVGASITPEQYAKLEPKLGPRVRAEMQNRDRAVQVLSERPPEGMRTFRPTPSMMSPVRQGRRGGGSVRRSSGGRRRRPSLLARRRSAGRRVRRPRLRV